MPKLLPWLALLALATACHKDNSEPTIDFGPNEGFTMRTNTNVPTSQNDPTDWTSDATWNDQERQLFADLNLSLTGSQLPAQSWEFSAYPNPCSLQAGGSYIIFNSSRTTASLTGMIHVKVVLVDAHYKVLYQQDTDITNSRGAVLAPMTNAASFSAGQLYRAYYVVYSPSQQVYYRGHGDIKTED